MTALCGFAIPDHAEASFCMPLRTPHVLQIQTFLRSHFLYIQIIVRDPFSFVTWIVHLAFWGPTTNTRP